MIGYKELLIFILVFTAIWDLSLRKVPNFFSIFFVLSGILYQVVFLNCYSSLCFSFLIFFVGLILWRHGFVGAADVKLIASFSLLLPTSRMADFLIYMCLSGGFLAVIYALLSRVLMAPPPSNRKVYFPVRLYRIAKWRLVRQAPFPYAVAIAISGIITLWT